MESIYTELSLYGSKNECTRTDNVFFPISEVCNGTASLKIMDDLDECRGGHTETLTHTWTSQLIDSICQENGEVKNSKALLVFLKTIIPMDCNP